MGGDSDPSPRTGDERVKLTTGAISDPEPGAQADDAADDWGDFGEIRAGFAGTNIGGGIVYSDRDDAVGAGPGPGQGGALDHDAALDDDEIAVMGCQGGGASGPVIAALLLLLGVAWRRRQLA
ncbi:MAG: hypothetical protein CSA66_02255 [Proteobacteria bacterium]|nr:MAG: hypothetical protein CSA66_02255 [Pseudomonadota bacterium]